MLAICYSIVKVREAGPILWQVERGEADELSGNYRVTYARPCGYHFGQYPKEVTALQRQ